eukprot:489266-Hanusia_phi.AAC.2
MHETTPVVGRAGGRGTRGAEEAVGARGRGAKEASEVWAAMKGEDSKKKQEEGGKGKSYKGLYVEEMRDVDNGLGFWSQMQMKKI